MHYASRLDRSAVRRRIGCAKTAIGIDERSSSPTLQCCSNGCCLPNGKRLSSKRSRCGNTFVTGRCRLLLPSLWIYQVGNVLALKRPQLAVEALDLLVAFKFELAEPDEACRYKAFELTEHFGVSFYDAAYHALATVNHGMFVTADDKYLQRVNPAAYVISLKDWR